MCDAPPTLREVAALAALSQSLVVHLDERIETGELPDPPTEWTVRENKWLATRHGIDASLIADPEGVRKPARELIAELVGELGPVAERLGCAEELQDVLRILDHGPSYLRQRAIRDAGGSASDIVDALIRELETDEPQTP